MNEDTNQKIIETMNSINLVKYVPIDDCKGIKITEGDFVDFKIYIHDIEFPEDSNDVQIEYDVTYPKEKDDYDKEALNKIICDFVIYHLASAALNPENLTDDENG